MIDTNALLEGFSLIFNLNCAIFLVIGMFFGILCGAIPGLSASIAVAVLVPITYSMEPTFALAFLCSTYAGAMYGGSITAILINTPGTAAAASTAFDGNPMASRGEAGRALGIALGASAIGGTFSYIFLLVAMYPIAYFAIKFGAPEMFLLALMGLSIIASVEDSIWKSIFAGAFGILIANFGISPTGAVRPYFGSPWLLHGVDQVSSMIGLLAFSELFVMLTKTSSSPVEKSKAKRAGREIIKGVLEPLKYPKTTIVSSIIGTVMGAIPAAGGSIASFLAYNQTKQMSKNPDSFGKGNPEGIVAPECANNASTGGALTTTLAFGIPGSAPTAVMLSAMMLHGLTPGPRLFIEQMPLVYGIIIALFLSQILMVIMGMGFCKSLSGIINVPSKIMAPTVAVFCVVGSFALRGSLFDVGLMGIFGIVGFFMKKTGYPVIAMVLGIILGQLTDNNFIRTAIRYRYNFWVFITRPISLTLVILIVLMISYPYIRKRRERIKLDSNK